MSIEKEFLAEECGVDFDEYVSDDLTDLEEGFLDSIQCNHRCYLDDDYDSYDGFLDNVSTIIRFEKKHCITTQQFEEISGIIAEHIDVLISDIEKYVTGLG